MSEKIEVRPYDQIRLTRNEDGGWSITLAPKDGGTVGALSDQAATLEEVVTKIRARYRVD